MVSFSAVLNRMCDTSTVWDEWSEDNSFLFQIYSYCVIKSPTTTTLVSD